MALQAALMEHLKRIYYRGGLRALVPALFKRPRPDLRAIGDVIGLDVFHGDGAIDFAKMRDAGAKFCYIKTSQGAAIDPAFRTNWSNAWGKVLRGGYHWFTLAGKPSGMDYNAWAVAQAGYFYNYFGKDHGELPPMVDYEDAAGAPSAGTLRLALTRFLIEFERLSGVKPLIYTSPGFWRSYGSADQFWLGYPLWIANYFVTQPAVPAPWTRWTFWQYTPVGPGLTYGLQSRGADMDAYNGSLSDLAQWSLLYRAVAGTAPPPALSLEERVAALETRVKTLEQIAGIG